MQCKLHPKYKGIRPPTAKTVTRHDCLCRVIYTVNNWQKGVEFIAEKLGLSTATIRKYGKDLGLPRPPKVKPDIDIALSEELQDEVRKEEVKYARQEKKVLLRQVAQLQREVEAALEIAETRQTLSIKPNGSTENEATAVIVVSDWHLDETVEPASVSHLNEFNGKVFQERTARLWRHAAKLIKKEQRSATIENVILALLGDYTTGSLHGYEETNRLSPIEAAIEAISHLSAGIQYLLDNTDVKKFTIPCHVGNHGRITQKIHHHNEEGNNLELFIYHALNNQFRDEDRVEFVIAEGYHTYLQVYGFTVRFHHGHAMRFNGGVGGPTIAINKALAQWNKGRKADYDVFGHFHTFFDGGNFICNGSLCGYSRFALKIKASYTPPVQAFFLIDKDDGKTVTCPIVLARDK